jgi:hypothetical protein
MTRVRRGVVLKVSKRKQEMLKKKHTESFYSLSIQWRRALIVIVYLFLEIKKFHDKKLTRVRYRRIVFEKECTRT